MHNLLETYGQNGEEKKEEKKQEDYYDEESGKVQELIKNKREKIHSQVAK